MGKRLRSSGGGSRNDNRKCGKAFKKSPKSPRSTGRSCCGYSAKNTQRLGHGEGHRKLVSA